MTMQIALDRLAIEAVAHLDQPGLAGEHLAGQLAAIFASHRPLYSLDDGRGDASVIFELLGAIPDLDTGAPANVFVVGALVSILEPTPAADVVDEYGFETRGFALDIGQQSLQSIAPVDAQSAFAVVGIGPHDSGLSIHRGCMSTQAVVASAADWRAAARGLSSNAWCGREVQPNMTQQP